MNIILFDQSEITPDNFLRLTDNRFEHIKNILKKECDDCIKVGEKNGKMGFARVHSICDSEVILSLELNDEPPVALPVTLVIALPRPHSFKKLLHTATVMGVKEIHLIKSWRVEKSYWSSPAITDKGIATVVDDALMQTRDTMAPQIYHHKKFKPFVEDELPTLMENRVTRLFHPSDSTEPFVVNKGEEYLFIIGPEGGFNEFEVDLFTEKGATFTSLGSRIQRVEQAVASILGYTSMSLL